MQVPALGQIGFITRSLHLFLAKLIHFLDSCLEFLLDRQSDFERERSHALHQKLAHGMIDLISDHSLADRYGVLDAITLADVLRHEAVLARVVSDRHSAPADATDYQTLQQSRPLAWRTLATIRSNGLRVFAKAQKVLFILLPGDVAGVSILD